MSVELSWRTPSSWAPAALADPIALLVDHAHCELGAASTAQTLIARHPAQVRLVDPLAALAAEELRHFRRVHRLIGELGGELQPIQTNPYAVALVRSIDKGAASALIDRLLISALIERRSLERFELLAAAAAEPQQDPRLAPIAQLFEELGPSEAGHARLFVELAQDFAAELPQVGQPGNGFDPEARLAHWAQREAEIIAALPFAARIHSGPLPTGAPAIEADRVEVTS